MNAETSVTDAIREQAAEWLVQLEDESTPEQQRAFQHWLEQDTRHRTAFEQMERLWTAASPQRKTTRLRPILGVAGIFLLAALLAMQLPWQYWQADFRTATGNISRIRLPDGSVATLNTNSAIDLDFSQTQRRINLIRGEVLLDVSKDLQRPMIITTPTAAATALGTHYGVRRGKYHSIVSVYESSVRVSTADGRTAQVVNAGQQVRVNVDSIELLAGKLLAEPDWSRHRLVFQDAPLPDVIARLGHYHRGLIQLDENAIQRRFTGVLPADDIDAALDLLASSMALDRKGFPPYIVYLSLRETP